MPTSSSLTASQSKTIHLLRALLREATYLPDANARSYFRNYILKRFRAYQPTWTSKQSLGYGYVEVGQQRLRIIQGRTSRMQSAANKGLNYLRRANTGELRCLQTVLWRTYGRIGERRYSLLEDLLVPREALGAGQEAARSPLQAFYHSDDRCLSYFDAPKKQSETHLSIHVSHLYDRLHAVLTSQSRKGIYMNHPIRRPYLLSPARNIWQRPMPIRRARNNVRRWYAEVMSRLLPPLPVDQWNALSDMAHGVTKASFVTRRRPANSVEAQYSEKHTLKSLVKDTITLNKPSAAERPPSLWRGHNITARFMARIYAKMLMLCCKLEWDEKRSIWRAIWGGGIHPPTFDSQLQVDAEALFAGVDVRGQVLKTSRKDAASHGKESKTRPKYIAVPFYVDYLPADHPQRAGVELLRQRKLKGT